MTENYGLELSVKMGTACNYRLWRGTLQQDARPTKLDGENPHSWQVPFSRFFGCFVGYFVNQILSLDCRSM